MTPFHYQSGLDYAIIPYDKNNTKRPISEKKFNKDCPELFTYLADNKHLIDQQSDKSKTMHRGKEFYALSKIGKYTFAPYIVAARDNTKFCAAVIKPTKTAWDKKKATIGVKHTILISLHKDESFITKDEAYYVCGILNSSIVIDYIQKTFKSTGYSLNNSNLYLPRYNPSDDKHKRIVKLSKKASGKVKPSVIAQIQDIITTIYVEMCKERKKKRVKR